jgi:REP element-mobilizing transposase RayT
MPGTYSRLLYHVVFSTKGRAAMMKGGTRGRIHEYLGGIIRSEGGVAYQIGGMPDHVHLLLRWRADQSIAALVRQMKSNSSRWIHETFPMMTAFAWQEGYGAFTVSQSQKDTVAAYIANQEAHHQNTPFEEEFVRFLRAHEIEYDPKYLWD